MACTSGDKTLLFECNEQNQGEACFKLGEARKGEEALGFYKRGCQMENVNSCAKLVELGVDKELALLRLKAGCEKGNAKACEKGGKL